tara:strand:- start:552 stop:1022 length:471 start_codon:yes stop_codon:yes gene_type:complete
MIYKLEKKQLDWCMDLALKRSGTHNHAETKNSVNCFKDKAGWYRHYLGVLGELAYSIHTGFKIRPFTGEADNGTDFDNGVDVKASDTKYKPNLLLFEKQFARKFAKSYVLVWIRLPYVQIIGEIKREKVIELKEIKNFGWGNSYFVNNKHLSNIIL